MPDEMTARQRWLAALEMRPVDRLPFWPKLDASYAPAQAAPFRDMSIDALHKWIGSDNHVWTSNCVMELHHTCSFTEEVGDELLRRSFRTPVGTLESLWRHDRASASWHPIAFPIRTREDIKTMTAYYEDLSAEPHPDSVQQVRDTISAYGEEAVVATGFGTSPLMDWVQWLAGIENAHLLLADHQAEVEALFLAMHKLTLRRAEIACEICPVDLFYLGENTSTTLISPAQHEKYCIAHIREYANAARSKKRRLVLHMCGHLKALLPDLAELPVTGFEAFTSPPVGDTTLLDGRTQCPDKCLIGGTNAALWIRPVNEIIKQIEEDLGALQRHRGIVVTSAGVMPPAAKPETIRAVCDWVKRYPVCV